MMNEFIARQIMKAKDKGGVKAGQDKYKTYFRVSLYKRYQENVDLILKTTEDDSGESYEDCIVAI